LITSGYVESPSARLDRVRVRVRVS